MNDCKRAKQESEITDQLLDFVERELSDEKVRLVAGAFMRVSVALVIEFMGYEHGSAATRQALENVLSEHQPRTLQ